MEARLDKKVAIVTGAGRGKGEVIARTLAAAGAYVTVNDINPDRAERVAREIRANGGQALGIHADVSNRFQCVKVVEAARAQWQRLDILVNHAHVTPRATILRLDEWDWTRCLDVNLKGTFFMSQLCGRVMAEENQVRGGGVIVNIASIAGVQIPLADRAAYCASQAGVVGFARECAREYASYGIRVHTILTADHVAEEEEIPADKLPAARRNVPDEVANAVLILCSDTSQMSGTTITIPGWEEVG